MGWEFKISDFVPFEVKKEHIIDLSDLDDKEVDKIYFDHLYDYFQNTKNNHFVYILKMNKIYNLDVESRISNSRFCKHENDVYFVIYDKLLTKSYLKKLKEKYFKTVEYDFQTSYFGGYTFYNSIIGVFNDKRKRLDRKFKDIPP